MNVRVGNCDGLQQHSPARPQDALAHLEELAPVGLPHGLEHFDGHSPVEFPLDVAVVAILEIDAVAQARLRRESP